jgi:hypothetical protein
VDSLINHSPKRNINTGENTWYQSPGIYQCMVYILNMGAGRNLLCENFGSDFGIYIYTKNEERRTKDPANYKTLNIEVNQCIN